MNHLGRRVNVHTQDRGVGDRDHRNCQQYSYNFHFEFEDLYFSSFKMSLAFLPKMIVCLKSLISNVSSSELMSK